MVKGLVLGDGSLHTRNGSVQVTSSTVPYLQWVYDALDWLSQTVFMMRTATQTHNESIKLNEKKDYTHDVTNTHDCYILTSSTHPWFQQQFKPWYRKGDTVTFPDDVTLTPTSLLFWYVSDWTLEVQQSSDYCSGAVRFETANEAGNVEKIKSIISSLGFEVSAESKQKRGARKFHLPTSETEEFLEFMGSPPPGFAYKWCHDNKTRYRECKRFHDDVCMTQTFTETPPDDWKQRHPHHWTEDGEPKYDQYHFDPR